MTQGLAAALADRYTIERELGAGGMATVYLAEDLKHRRRVALKVLRPELAQAIGPDRFLREIETTANLRHPHILPLYDSGAAGDFLFYVMPYVEGESLRDRLARERQLPLDEALQIAREVADALSYAHSRGVIHRDIKPENILLESGHAVVADFGIARAVSAAGGEQLTQTGVTVGTPAYMSPEQAAGEKDLDGRSDLYALGSVLYEMLAGQTPFTGPTVESLIHQQLTAEPVPVTQLRPAVPAEIAGVLQRVLAKNPADRFSPAAQFAEALRPRSDSQARPARAVARTPTRRNAVIGAVVVIVVAAAGVALLRPRAAPAPVPGRTTQVTLDPGLELDPALSPDGSMVAYAAGPFGRLRIFVRQVAGGRPIALSGSIPGDHRNPRWSPDGSRVAFEGTAGAFVVPVLGGTPNRLFATDTSFRGSLAWSPDGRSVAYAGVDRVYRHALESGHTTILAAGLYNPHSLSWSANGSRLAFVSDNSAWVTGSWLSPTCLACSHLFFANVAPSAIWSVPADSGTPVALTDKQSMNMSPVWLPDGNLLFVSDREGSRDIYWLEVRNDGGPAGRAVRLTTGLDAHTISVSARGAAVAYSRFEPQTNVYAIDLPARGPVSIAGAQQITRGNQLIEGIGVTPDGRWLAFDSDRAGNQDIYKMELPDGDPIQLTTHPAPDFLRAWSWDGQFLSGHSIRTGQRDPFILSADGARFEFVSQDPRQERYAFLSTDGRRVIFDREVGGVVGERTPVIAERGDEGRWSEPRLVTDGGGMMPAWSPDGRRILVVRRGGVSLLDLASGAETRVVPRGHNGWAAEYVAWAPDGRTAYYTAQDGQGKVSLWSVPAEGGTPRMLVLFDDPSRTPSRIEFAVDRRRFYFTLPGHQSDVWVLELTRP